MAYSLHQRLLSAFFAALLLLGGFGYSEPGWTREHTTLDAAQSNRLLGVVSIHINPDGTGLSVQADRPFTSTETRHFSVLRLPYPYRLLLEIPNARLETTQTLFPVNRNGIDRVELSENRSPFYNSVRAIVYVNDHESLSRLNTAFEGNALKVDSNLSVAMPLAQNPLQQAVLKPTQNLALKPVTKIQPLPPVAKHSAAIRQTPPLPVAAAKQPEQAPLVPQTVLGNAFQSGTYIIEDIYFRDNRLYIKGNPGSELRVKNRFPLTAPTRLVLDIDNAVLASKALTNPIFGSNNDIRQIRVGQFDDKTVRLVIEGERPEQFEAIYSGRDRSLLTISPYSATSIAKLSANTQVGQVESIDLKRDSSGTTLRLAASTPIVHRFIKQDDRITIDLLNAAAHPTTIDFDAKQYPELAKMRLEPLTDGQPNSKLSITLASSGVRVTPSFSEDGKVLELTLKPDDTLPGGLASLLNGLDAGKAPFPARIVVDAGHGGKDIGANRSGVNEKDLNLSLALMVRDALVSKGFQVYMTRSTDVFLPLPQITAYTNQVKPDLFISIHHNASVNSAIHGIETYYYTPQSLALAKRVHAREINSVSARDGGVKKAMFYVIHHTNVPAILCEVGYVSNPSELESLQGAERKQKTARAIADGVVDYLKSRISAKAK